MSSERMLDRVANTLFPYVQDTHSCFDASARECGVDCGCHYNAYKAAEAVLSLMEGRDNEV